MLGVEPRPASLLRHDTVGSVTTACSADRLWRSEWCGTQASLTNRVGVSVGWGDRYPWDFVFQWIDITGLPGGTYRVRATVDIHDFYRETDEFDNCVWSEVRIPALVGQQGEGPAQRPRMRPQRHDPGCCLR